MGDALGAPVEFLSLEKIRREFGEDGIRDFSPAYGKLGAITDDTQMTLFTAEGVIRAYLISEERGIRRVSEPIHRAYLRWFITQGEMPSDVNRRVTLDGGLVQLKPLWSRRAPGLTCLSALRATRGIGMPADNDSKGCGTVMRTAPIGLGAPREEVFQLGMEASALTHGHVTATLSAGFLSLLISEIVNGAELGKAIATATIDLEKHPGHEETLAAVQAALLHATTGGGGDPLGQELGEGWIAEEAVAIALYSVLVTSNFEDAVILAVNRDGDSDSTGAIAGNLAGALYGVEAIPARWLEPLELCDDIATLADDLCQLVAGNLSPERQALYPWW